MAFLTNTEKKLGKVFKKKGKNQFEHVKSRVYNPTKKEPMADEPRVQDWHPVAKSDMNLYEQTIWSLVAPDPPELLFSKKQELEGWNDDLDVFKGTDLAESSYPPYSKVEYYGGWPSNKKQMEAPVLRAATTKPTTSIKKPKTSSKEFKKKIGSAPTRPTPQDEAIPQEPQDEFNSLPPSLAHLKVVEKASPISIMRNNERSIIEDPRSDFPLIKLSDEWIALKSNPYLVAGGPFSTIFARKTPGKENEPNKPHKMHKGAEEMSNSWSEQRKRAQCTLRELKSVFPPLVDEKKKIYNSLSKRSDSTGLVANIPRKYRSAETIAFAYTNPLLDRQGKILKGRPKISSLTSKPMPEIKVSVKLTSSIAYTLQNG
jgi:hypothetical protein